MGFLDTIMGVEFQQIECCRDGCHAVFALPSGVVDRLRKSHEWFYCPFGHQQHYSQETTEERLRKELAQAQHQREQVEADRSLWRNRATIADRRVSAAKGQVTRIKNRIVNGVCPCCNRHFDNLHRHMTSQHPDYRKQEVQP